MWKKYGQQIRYAWVFVAVIFLDVIGRPWPPTTLTVFSTSSNFNLVNIRMSDGILRHASVFTCSNFSRSLVSICRLESLATCSICKETLGLMSEVGLALRTEKCMSANITLHRGHCDPPYMYRKCTTQELNGLHLVYWSH